MQCKKKSPQKCAIDANSRKKSKSFLVVGFAIKVFVTIASTKIM